MQNIFILTIFWLTYLFPNVYLTPTLQAQLHYIKTDMPSPKVPAKSYLVLQAQNRAVLASHNPHKKVAPASLTKLMTLYLLEEALKHKELKLSDMIFVSKKAWSRPGSRMFIKEGSYVSVDVIRQGIAVASGNDATTALAEHLAGSEAGFVQMMNQKAKDLGMTKTHFANASGLPNDNHYTCANDLGLLASSFLQNHPSATSYLQQKTITYNGIKQFNRNRLLWRDETITGMKTGHTQAAGYCLIASAQRHKTPFIAITLGSDTESDRDESAKLLLHYADFNFDHILVENDDNLENATVYYGDRNEIKSKLSHNLTLSLPKRHAPVSYKTQIYQDIYAPVKEGDQVGEYEIYLGKEKLDSIPIVSKEAVISGGRWSCFKDWLSIKARKLSSLLPSKYTDNVQK